MTGIWFCAIIKLNVELPLIQMLTLFTFGYYGWGNATGELVTAMDAAERKRGFKPPIFFDIRLRRNVRAAGFVGDSFAKLLPRGRYHWWPRLGNKNIGTKKRRIAIADPSASKLLLDEAVKYARKNRRIIFFCSCEFPRSCHRNTVANLLLKDAKRIGRRIKIEEWPDGARIRTSVHVTQEVFKGVCGSVLNVRLPDRKLPRNLVGLPWGSIVDVVSGNQSVPIVTGPATFQKGWKLPILFQHDSNESSATLHREAEKWLKSRGIGTKFSSQHA